jgi:nitric oxide reductase large subunit
MALSHSCRDLVAGIGVAWAALYLSQRRWHVGLAVMRLASAFLTVANWIRPNRGEPFLRQPLHLRA